MKGTIVRNYPNGELAADILYLLHDEERALKRFKKEYFHDCRVECIPFDTDERPDMYQAYQRTGCAIFW